MSKHEDICPICGSAGLIKKNITEVFEYKERSLEIENYVIYECLECGESIVDDASLRNAEKLIKDFQREVDGLLTSKEIIKIRKALGFTQENFGLILGGGRKAFARYESCSVTQSKAMDNLLRIVFEKPEALKIIDQNNCANRNAF